MNAAQPTRTWGGGGEAGEPFKTNAAPTANHRVAEDPLTAKSSFPRKPTHNWISVHSPHAPFQTSVY